MGFISYEDVLEVMEFDPRFSNSMLTVKFCKELKDNYPGYNEELERKLFYKACSYGRIDTVKYFIKSSEFSQVALNAGLNNAVTKKEYKVASYLLDCGADPSCSNSFPVKKAARDSQIKFLKKLKKMGFDLKFDEDCLLECAAEYNVKWKLIEFLVASGLNNQKYLNMLLENALIQDNVYMVNFLIDNGATPDNCKHAYVKYIYR